MAAPGYPPASSVRSASAAMLVLSIRTRRCLFKTSVPTRLSQLRRDRHLAGDFLSGQRRSGCLRPDLREHRGSAGLIEVVTWIRDAMVMDSHQHFDETVGDDLQFTQGDVAFVELPVVAYA